MNILIFGHSRAGKTTLAQRLGRAFRLNIINEDHLVNTFERAFPALGINSGSDYARTARNISPFMAHYLCELAEHASYAKGCPFVVDATFFDFDIAIPIMRQELYDRTGMALTDAFIFIGLDNHKTAEELFADVRKHDTPEDWSYTFSDADLLAHCAENIGADEAFYEHWRELAWLRYDVAEGRERVFAKIMTDVKALFDKGEQNA